MIMTEATPKAIMRTMGVKGLTLFHLKSHLQVLIDMSKLIHFMKFHVALFVAKLLIVFSRVTCFMLMFPEIQTRKAIR